MNITRQSGLCGRRHRRCLAPAGLICVFAFWVTACGSDRQIRIAVVPQTEGTIFWEAEHTGAEQAADKTGTSIYWNAPTSEDDVEAQIALVDRIVDKNYQGLVLAPDQALSLMMPVRRALAHGIPTVIVGSPLPISPGGNLSYILNDDEEGGRIAAERAAFLMNGHGTVALLGINPDITGIMIRARSFEQIVARNYPGIRIVEKRMGSYNPPHEQQVAEETLRANPDLDVIVALMSTTVDAALSAIDTTGKNRLIRVIGFDQGGYPLSGQQSNLDSVVQEDIRSMGLQAIELISARLRGQSVPAIVHLHPKLITRENMNTPEVRSMLSQDWTLGRWRWSSIR
jgi:ribose transport system substrate-binding protein